MTKRPLTPTNYPSQINGDTGSDLRARLDRDGFVLIPNILSAPELSILRASSDGVTKMGREGKWPHIRTLPKQFPPWTSDPSDGIWGIQHLLHPSLPQSQVFQMYYFNDVIISAVKELLSSPDTTVEDSELIMELFNLLTRPDKDFELKWHRDDISADAGPEEEMERLGQPGWHAQWNLALYEDTSLIVVPGSHKRPRTDAEREADALEPNMPGQMIVKMEPGDVVFYNNNILHRGAYESSKDRMTLHGSIGHVKGSSHRARNVLQHGIGEWVGKIDFSGLNPRMREKAEMMRGNLLEMGKEGGWGGDFSHKE